MAARFTGWFVFWFLLLFALNNFSSKIPAVFLLMILPLLALLLPLILIPVGVSKGIKKLPYLTSSLIVLNTLVFFFAKASAPDTKSLEVIFQNFGFMVGGKAWYTWFTSLFVHAGAFHLVGNMFFLWAFGPALEEALGRLKYLLLYLAGGMIAGLTHALISQFFLPYAPTLPLVGASGAIAALLGLYTLRFYRNEVALFYLWILRGIVGEGILGILLVSPMIILSFWLAKDLAGGLTEIQKGIGGGVAYWAHIGGFLFGMIVAKFIHLEKEAGKEYLVEEAASLGRRGDFEEAAEKYEKLISQESLNPEAHFEAGKMEANAGNKEKGTQHLIKAIEQFLRKKSPDKATQVYRELNFYYSDILLEPGLQFRMGTLLETGGHFELALDVFQKVVTNYPNTPQAESALFRLGQVYSKMGDETSARKTFEEFLQKYPLSPWRTLAEVEVKKLTTKTPLS